MSRRLVDELRGNLARQGLKRGDPADRLMREAAARIGELEGALKQIAGGKDDHDQPLSARLLMEFAYAALSERDDGPNNDPLPPEDDPHPDLPGGA